MIKVLHLLNTGSFSGAENVVCQIIKMFQGDSAIEMAYSSLDGEINKVLKEKGIRFYPFFKLTYSTLKNIIQEYKPDIIHAHDRWASCIAALIASSSVRVISHIHGKFDDMSRITCKSFLYKIAVRKISHVFWVSQSAYQECFFKKEIREKSSVLYNVLDKFELYEKCKRDTIDYHYDIVFLGRLTYPKNPQRLMDVLKLVKEKKRDVKVAIIGDGNLMEETKQISCENDLSHNLDFFGFLNNPYKILSDSKVMIMTSRTEGTPMSVLEAMALGVPLVSTPADGICDLIDEGKNGFLSSDNDILADKLIYILEHQDVRDNMSKYAQDKFDVICNVKDYKAELEEIYYQESV